MKKVKQKFANIKEGEAHDLIELCRIDLSALKSTKKQKVIFTIVGEPIKLHKIINN